MKTHKHKTHKTFEEFLKDLPTPPKSRWDTYKVENFQKYISEFYPEITLEEIEEIESSSWRKPFLLSAEMFGTKKYKIYINENYRDKNFRFSTILDGELEKRCERIFVKHRPSIYTEMKCEIIGKRDFINPNYKKRENFLKAIEIFIEKDNDFNDLVIKNGMEIETCFNQVKREIQKKIETGFFKLSNFQITSLLELTVLNTEYFELESVNGLVELWFHAISGTLNTFKFRQYSNYFSENKEHLIKILSEL